jgi:hypothetical protein
VKKPVFQIRIRIQLIAWIRVCILNADPHPDPERGKSAPKKRKINSEDQKK